MADLPLLCCVVLGVSAEESLCSGRGREVAEKPEENATVGGGGFGNRREAEGPRGRRCADKTGPDFFRQPCWMIAGRWLGLV